MTDASDGVQWESAKLYAENLSLAGHEDWRLPNVRELQSIVDYGRITPSIDPVFSAEWHFYWSSTSRARFSGQSWAVRFFFGEGSYFVVDPDFQVRAVRSAH